MPERTFEISSTLAAPAETVRAQGGRAWTGVAALLTVLCAAAPVRGTGASPPPAEECGAYADEGLFVSAPADAAGVLALLITGSAATLACTPFDFVLGLARSDTAFGASAGACGNRVGEAARRVAYLVGGAPFFAVKKLAWDAPRRAIASGKHTSAAPRRAAGGRRRTVRLHGRVRADMVPPSPQ